MDRISLILNISRFLSVHSCCGILKPTPTHLVLLPHPFSTLMYGSIQANLPFPTQWKNQKKKHTRTQTHINKEQYEETTLGSHSSSSSIHGMCTKYRHIRTVGSIFLSRLFIVHAPNEFNLILFCI